MHRMRRMGTGWNDDVPATILSILSIPVESRCCGGVQCLVVLAAFKAVVGR